MKTLTLGLAIALAASSAVAQADTSTNSAFVQKAQQDLLGQYALATLAKSRASDPAVRSLAAQAAANAASSNTFLEQYAKAHGISLKSQPGIRAEAQYGEMTALKGSDFDHRFAQDLYADTQLQSDDFDPSAAGDATLKQFG